LPRAPLLEGTQRLARTQRPRTDLALILIWAHQQIRGCPNLTAEGLAAFADLLPHCRVLQEKGQRKEYRLVIPDDPLAPLSFL
jgi:hypothetical protein